MTTKPPGPVLVTIETDDGAYTLHRVAIRPGGRCFDCNGSGWLEFPDDTDTLHHECPYCDGTGQEPEFVHAALPIDTSLPDGWSWATPDDITEGTSYYGVAS